MHQHSFEQYIWAVNRITKIVPKRDWDHLLTLTLTLDDLESHIVVNVSSTVTNTTIWFVASLSLIVDVRTYGQTDILLGLLGHLRRWPKMDKFAPLVHFWKTKYLSLQRGVKIGFLISGSAHRPTDSVIGLHYEPRNSEEVDAYGYRDVKSGVFPSKLSAPLSGNTIQSDLKAF